MGDIQKREKNERNHKRKWEYCEKSRIKRKCTIQSKETLGPGSVFTCGENSAGQLGLGVGVDELERKILPTLVENLTDIVDICAGGMHTLCIDENGKVNEAWRRILEISLRELSKLRSYLAPITFVPRAI